MLARWVLQQEGETVARPDRRADIRASAGEGSEAWTRQDQCVR